MPSLEQPSVLEASFAGGSGVSGSVLAGGLGKLSFFHLELRNFL